MKLTEIDFKTVLTVDSSYILNKGAELYNRGEYKEALNKCITCFNIFYISGRNGKYRCSI